MAASHLSKAVRQIRETLHNRTSLTDGQLLLQFIEQRDQAAFASLVHRHGGLVWGVCRRVLGHHDAEDAFQATFLVLARKASTVKPREFVANWLYGVAYRTARKVKATATKRWLRERQVSNMPERVTMPQDPWAGIQAFLDQELACLPSKYRAAIILCDLEGKTRRDSARQLKIPEGTLSSRLTTARTMLARRLRRHGVTLSGGVLATVLNAAMAQAPSGVTASTIKFVPLFVAGQATGLISARVAALADGMLKALWLSRFSKGMGTLLALAVVALGMPVPEQRADAQRVNRIANDIRQVMVDLDVPPDSHPSAKQLVDYLNDNAQRMRTLRCDLDLTVTTGTNAVGTRGKMLIQQPRNLRLIIDSLGKQVADVGSNATEFWYWVSKAAPEYQFYCSHKDLADGRVQTAPFPFYPDWIVEVMGMGNYGPAERYKLKHDDNTLRLVELPASKSIRREILLKRTPASSPEPQVLVYSLWDDVIGKEICSAKVLKIQIHPQTACIVPRVIEFRWCPPKQQPVTLTLKLDGLDANPRVPDGVFTRRPLPGVRSFNLAAEPSGRTR